MVDFTVLVLPGAFASSVSLTLDILAAAARLAPRCGCAAPRWRVFGTQATVDLGHGLHLQAKPLPRTVRADSSVWIVPGLGTETPRAVEARLARPDAMHAARVLGSHARAGGAVAASCSAVFLLHAAGLLDGRSVTTTWWLAPYLQRIAPGCRVDAGRMVACDGPLTTAGAACSQADLMLQLLRTRFGPALAQAVARALLIDARQSQGQFVVPAMLADGSALVARIVARFEEALPDAPGVAELAAECGMSERTLARHVKAATGRSTSALLQGVRLTRARMLLETSKYSVEQVAEQVGYVDATALRRLMRKVMGASPRQFRPSLAPA